MILLFPVLWISKVLDYMVVCHKQINNRQSQTPAFDLMLSQDPRHEVGGYCQSTQLGVVVFLTCVCFHVNDADHHRMGDAISCNVRSAKEYLRRLRTPC